MTLKIERISGKRRTRIRLSGAFRSEHLDQVKREIERCGSRVALDLEEVDLADVDAIRFLNACEGWCRSAQLLTLRSEEHTSELQSPCNLVCRLLLEKKKNTDCAIS